MSRIGKQPVGLPKGVTAQVSGRKVSIKGPKGELHYECGAGVKVAQDSDTLVVALEKSDSIEKQHRANFGTTRAILNNMVKGVTQGWKKSLELNGVGFTAKLAGQVMTLATGYSHDVKVIIPKGVNCAINKNVIELESCDKELLGTLAARIRRVCPPEPYLGKGIKYTDETIRRKAGKAGKK